MDARGAPRPSSRRLSRWAGGLLVAAAVVSGGRLAAADGPAAATAPAAKPVVLLVLADVSETGERAAQAIAAHLRLVGLEPEVVREPTPAHDGGAREPSQTPPVSTLGEIVARSRDLVAEKGARGVLWVGAGSGELSLHLYERDGDRLFARRVSTEKGQTAAAIESLALIARSAAAELLEGKVAVMAQVARADAPLAPGPGEALAPAAAGTGEVLAPAAVGDAIAPRRLDPTVGEGALARTGIVFGDAAAADDTGRDAAAPRRGGMPGTLALSAGYLGSTATRSALWRSALALEAGWRPVPSLTFGLGYEIMPPDATGGGPMPYQFQRHPIFAAAGYRFIFPPRWDLELGARGTVNILTRSAMGMAGVDAMSVMGSLGPTMELGFRVFPFLRAGVLLGVDVALDPPPAIDPRMSSERLQVLGGLGLQLELGRSGKKAPRNTASR